MLLIILLSLLIGTGLGFSITNSLSTPEIILDNSGQTDYTNLMNELILSINQSDNSEDILKALDSIAFQISNIVRINNEVNLKYDLLLQELRELNYNQCIARSASALFCRDYLRS